MEGIVNGYANTLLALTHTEGAAELYLLTKIILSDEILKLLYYLARALDMAGATYTHSYFKHNINLSKIYFVVDAAYTASTVV